MDPTQNSLFALAEHRLAWTDQRQALLAQNIANASLPGYRPRDVRPFAQALQNATSLAPLQTEPGHLAGTIDPAQQAAVIEQPNAITADGNGVALDEQLTQVADTETTQEMVAAIYKKYLGMFNTALGNSGGSQ